MLSKLQSNAAPCQSEVVVLKKGLMLKSVILKVMLSPPPHPNFSETITCLRNNSKHKARSAQNDVKRILLK